MDNNYYSYNHQSQSNYGKSRGRGRRGRGRRRGRGYHQRNNRHYYNDYNQSHDNYKSKQDTDHKSDDNQDDIIAKFDANPLLMRSNPKKIETSVKLKTYYHTNPSKGLLKVNESISPTLIKSECIKSLIGIDFNKIQIDYSTLKQNKEKSPKCLNQKKPPKYLWSMNRIDPLCYEIDKILNETEDSLCDKFEKLLKDKEKENDDIKEKDIGFITYRHNLRAIANCVLFKLAGLKMYDKCGINIGIHRKGNDIYLENITEYDENPSKWFNANMVYGHLFEHIIESLSNNIMKKEIKPMKYQKKCVERDEIRALNQFQFNDIKVWAAAEMDAIMKNADDKIEIIEIKSCQIAKKFRYGQLPKIAGIQDFKLLKYWTQIKFGGVDSVLIGFHKDGIIQRTQVLKDSDIEKLFPVITSKCIEIVYEVLRWISNLICKLPQNNMYLVSFDTNDRQNTHFVMKYMPSKIVEKQLFQVLSEENANEKDKMLCNGLIINPRSHQFEFKPIV